MNGKDGKDCASGSPVPACQGSFDARYGARYRVGNRARNRAHYDARLLKCVRPRNETGRMLHSTIASAAWK